MSIGKADNGVGGGCLSDQPFRDTTMTVLTGRRSPPLANQNGTQSSGNFNRAGNPRSCNTAAARLLLAFLCVMIIFGLSTKEKAKQAGRFQCPVCKAQRTYAELRHSRRFTLFFIPVLPLGSSSTGRVICTHCGSEFSESLTS